MASTQKLYGPYYKYDSSIIVTLLVEDERHLLYQYTV